MKLHMFIEQISFALFQFIALFCSFFEFFWDLYIMIGLFFIKILSQKYIKGYDEVLTVLWKKGLASFALTVLVYTYKRIERYWQICRVGLPKLHPYGHWFAPTKFDANEINENPQFKVLFKWFLFFKYKKWIIIGSII